jgi:peptide chain release factor subunit 1
MNSTEKTLKRIEDVQGKGTTLVSLYIPGTSSQVARANQMVTAEYGTAKNIKSSATKNAVLGALRSVQQQIKLYAKHVPENGIAVFCGADTSEVIEAPKPIKALLYRCDSFFHTEILREMMVEDGTEYGFIILDGKEALFATVNGSSYGNKILLKYLVDLPSKHGRGGQSANRFERQRV